MYRIANYSQLYNPTNTKGGDLLYAQYVKMPIKPRGKGLRALLRKDNGLEIFGIWCLLLQAATETTTPKMRGMLLNYQDEPATAEDIADAISLSDRWEEVENALNVLIEMHWIENVPDAERGRTEGVVDAERGRTEGVVNADEVYPKLTKAKEKLREPKAKDKPTEPEQNLNSVRTEDEHCSNITPTTKTKANESKEELELKGGKTNTFLWSIEFDRKITAVFGELLPNERTTFRKIRIYLQTLDLEAMNLAIKWIGEVKIWGDDHGKDNIEIKKCFVSKIKRLGWIPE